MPELPEVETVRQTLLPLLKNKNGSSQHIKKKGNAFANFRLRK